MAFAMSSSTSAPDRKVTTTASTIGNEGDGALGSSRVLGHNP